MSPTWLARVQAALLLTLPATAGAGGFEHPDNGARAVGRGGAFVVGASDLTALQHNPGALSRLGGTRILLHHNLVFHRTAFDRAPLAEGWGDYAGLDPLPDAAAEEDQKSLFALGGFFALSSDFGLDDWVFALGVYGPSSVGSHQYDPYGPTSFMLTDLEVLLLYYTAAVAWQIPEKFGVGLSLQYVDMPKMKYGLVVDAATTSQLDPIPRAMDSTQLEATLDLEDRFAFTAQIGMWWRPVRWLEVGAAGRVIPIQLEAKGGVSVDKPELVSEAVSARLPLTLPATARGGVRYIHEVGGQEVFDIEANVHWEGWSSIDAYEVDLEGRINGQEVLDLDIPKRWQDTVSVRLGGDWRVLPDRLTLRAGGFYETGAVPDNYSHVDFPSFDRFGVGGGLTVDVGPVALTASYLHVFQEDREVSERHGKYFQQRPLKPCPEDCDGLSGVVGNAGTIESSIALLSLGAEVKFDFFD